jgi:hypothetical protein
MTLRFRVIHGVVTAAVLAGSVTLGTAFAQQRDGGLLPLKESGMITVAGCLLRGDQVRAGDDDKYVLANPTLAPLVSVPEAACSANFDANAVQLDNPKKGNIDEAMLGRWVSITGRLERETSTDDILRELDVTSASLLPVDPPRVARIEPEPIAAPSFEPAAVAASEPEPAPVPVATSGQTVELPKTAGPLPLVGLLGLLACGGSLVLRSLRRQRV